MGGAVKLGSPASGSVSASEAQSAGAGTELRLGPVEQAAIAIKAHVAAAAMRHRRMVPSYVSTPRRGVVGLGMGILRWQNRKCATAAGTRLRDWN